MTWTQERIDQLTRLWKDGHSASKIAARLGCCTRNAVIGKINRLGLAYKGKTPNQSLKGRARPRKCVKRRNNRHVIEGKAYKSLSRPGALSQSLTYCPLPAEDTPRGPLVMFADLEAHHCRAPYGDPKQPGFGFCGCKPVPGLPYCEDHARRFYAASKPRNRDGNTNTWRTPNSTPVQPAEREEVLA